MLSNARYIWEVVLFAGAHAFTLHFDVDLTKRTPYIAQIQNEVELTPTKFHCKISTPNLIRMW
jgi:hypothetical protein